MEVEAIGHFRLLLCTGFYLDLTFVVPSFRRNLVLVSYLDELGYLCSFGDNSVWFRYCPVQRPFCTFLLFYFLSLIRSFLSSFGKRTREPRPRSPVKGTLRQQIFTKTIKE